MKEKCETLGAEVGSWKAGFEPQRFRIWGLGFRVWSLGFRVWGLGFGV